MRIKTLRIKLHKAKLPPWLYQLILSLFSVRVKGGVEEYLTTALHDKLGALSAEVVAHATLVVVFHHLYPKVSYFLHYKIGNLCDLAFC